MLDVLKRVQSCVREAQLGKASEPQTQVLNANLANRADKLISPFKQNNYQIFNKNLVTSQVPSN